MDCMDCDVSAGNCEIFVDCDEIILTDAALLNFTFLTLPSISQGATELTSLASTLKSSLSTDSLSKNRAGSTDVSVQVLGTGSCWLCS